MAKKFNIHEWQANQWLKNQLNEVEIKKVVDQSMNNDDIGKLQDVIRNNNLGKILNTIAVILDRTGGAPEGAAQMIADLVPYIDLADPTVTPDEEEFTPDLEDDELKRGAIQQMMAKEKELGEMSTTGTGAAFTPGTGAAYASPNAFGNNRRKKQKAYMGYKEVNEQRKRKNTSSGYMGYSEPVSEQEEEYEGDVEALEKVIDNKINTRDEWVDMFQLLMAHSEEIQGLNDSHIKSLLQQSLKDI
jgi:hypothetical protein